LKVGRGLSLICLLTVLTKGFAFNILVTPSVRKELNRRKAQKLQSSPGYISPFAKNQGVLYHPTRLRLLLASSAKTLQYSQQFVHKALKMAIFSMFSEGLGEADDLGRLGGVGAPHGYVTSVHFARNERREWPRINTDSHGWFCYLFFKTSVLIRGHSR